MTPVKLTPLAESLISRNPDSLAFSSCAPDLPVVLYSPERRAHHLAHAGSFIENHSNSQ